MNNKTMIAVLMMAGFVCSSPAAQADKAKLAKRQDSLNSEYSLAKESNFYFVFDVRGRKFELRVRGMVLRSWPLQSMRFWGQPDFSGNVELVRKSSIKAPERIFIKPGDAEKVQPTPASKPTPAAAANPAEFDLEALELKDMPKTFSLDFDNGLRVTVKTKSSGSGGFLGRMRAAWRWYIDLPMRNVFGARPERGLSELELTFDNEKDAQSLYWHFFDGIKGIIL
jgi:hypothetical protein